jgi:hypothetical protein
MNLKRSGQRSACLRIVAALIAGILQASMTRADDRILIPAKLIDRALRLAFDTGAPATLIFKTVASARGLIVAEPDY